MEEPKHARFRRLAEARTERALKEIRKIGNLAAPGRYEYSEAEVKAIISALRKEVSAVEGAFKRRGAARFSLRSR